MVKGDWGFLATIFVCLILAGVAVLRDPKKDGYSPYQSRAANQQATSTLVIGLPSQTAVYGVTCKNPANVIESDLCAQWKAANAAEANVVWAERQFFISMLSAIGLGITILFTALATRAAMRSAKAAEDSVNGADRPHILVSELWLGPISEDDPTKAYLTYKFWNHGIGPGWVQRKRFGIFVGSKAADLRSLDPMTWDEVVWPIAPSHWFGYEQGKGSTVTVSAAQRNEIETGSAYAFIFGEFEYADTGGKVRRHSFVYQCRSFTEKAAPTSHKFWHYA